MQTIAKNIFIEDQFPGVTLGAINLPCGLIQIDAPPSMEDSRAWRATLLNMGGSAERVLVNLDAHPDRTLGARSMDCTVIAHEKTANIFRGRPTTFKPQEEQTGAMWENIPNLGNIRWVQPEISFSHRMDIYWDQYPIILEHHPGPSSGSIWVISPEAKVVFIGDAVLRNQTPFLAYADIPVWLDTVKLLLSPSYRGWLVVSGRGGLTPVDFIRNQVEYLNQILNKLGKLAAKKSPPEEIEGLISPLLSDLKIPTSQMQHNIRRLRFGLYQYYIRHYLKNNYPLHED